MSEPITPRRRLRRRLVRSGLILFVIAFIAAAIPAVSIGVEVFSAVTTPIAILKAGEASVVELPDTVTRYSVSACVQQEFDNGPDVEITVTPTGGQTIETSVYDGWSEIGDEIYRGRVLITSDAPGPITVLVTPEDQADLGSEFAVFRHEQDIFETRANEAMPIWAGAGLLGLVSFGLIMGAVGLYATEPDDTGLGDGLDSGPASRGAKR